MWKEHKADEEQMREIGVSTLEKTRLSRELIISRTI